mgnify:CR=1 FL=1
MDTMTGLKRTNYCGDLCMQDVGKAVTVCGWVQRQRDLGALIFVDLRDRTGIVQLGLSTSARQKIFSIRHLPCAVSMCSWLRGRYAKRSSKKQGNSYW